MKGLKTIIIASLMGGAVVVGCQSGDKQNSTPYEAEEFEEPLLPYGATDTIDGVKVSPECAIINYNLEDLLDRIERVKSPDMLMRLKSVYQHDIDSLTANLSGLAANEKDIIASQKVAIAEAYATACRQYEIPADGVIANLKYCIQDVNAAQSHKALEDFMRYRTGMLRNLDIIHLCVESRSTKIPEVKRLAAQLQHDLDNKKKRYSVR